MALQQMRVKYRILVTGGHGTVGRALVAELRQRTTFRERTAAEREAYSNTSDAHITGIYEWVNEVHRGRLMNYDLRLQLEVVVPRPAATLLWAVTDLPPDPTGPPLPPPFDVLLDDPNTLAFETAGGTSVSILVTVPEPGIASLLAAGAMLAGLARRRSRFAPNATA